MPLKRRNFSSRFNMRYVRNFVCLLCVCVHACDCVFFFVCIKVSVNVSKTLIFYIFNNLDGDKIIRHISLKMLAVICFV